MILNITPKCIYLVESRNITNCSKHPIKKCLVTMSFPYHPSLINQPTYNAAEPKLMSINESRHSHQSNSGLLAYPTCLIGPKRSIRTLTQIRRSKQVMQNNRNVESLSLHVAHRHLVGNPKAAIPVNLNAITRQQRPYEKNMPPPPPLPIESGYSSNIAGPSA